MAKLAPLRSTLMAEAMVEINFNTGEVTSETLSDEQRAELEEFLYSIEDIIVYLKPGEELAQLTGGGIHDKSPMVLIC